MTESIREISERGLEELKALLMQALEEAARFKGRERQAARGDRAAQGLEGTSEAQAQWHGEGGGCRQERGAEGPDAARDHRRNEIALPRSLAIDQFLEAEPAHGDAHGLHMPVRQRADAFEATIRRRKLPGP